MTLVYNENKIPVILATYVINVYIKFSIVQSKKNENRSV